MKLIWLYGYGLWLCEKIPVNYVIIGTFSNMPMHVIRKLLHLFDGTDVRNCYGNYSLCLKK